MNKSVLQGFNLLWMKDWYERNKKFYVTKKYWDIGLLTWIRPYYWNLTLWDMIDFKANLNKIGYYIFI